MISVDVKDPIERHLVFTQIIKTGTDGERDLFEDTGEASEKEEIKEFDRMIPMIIIFSCLTTVLVFVMIIITLVKKSSEYSNNCLQTHVAFNKNLDKDINHAPDILHNTKGNAMGSPPEPSMHKVYSLDQLNQVTFEGFTSLNPNLVTNKYNTLPARQIAYIEQIYNSQEQAPLIHNPKSILVKKVTFEKPASSSSSATSTPTMEISSFNEGNSVSHYLDMGNIGGNQPSFNGYHSKI